MIDGVFRSLLSCEDCKHSVEVHDGSGCNSASCGCAFNRNEVIEQNITIAKSEYRWSRDAE